MAELVEVINAARGEFSDPTSYQVSEGDREGLVEQSIVSCLGSHKSSKSRHVLDGIPVLSIFIHKLTFGRFLNNAFACLELDSSLSASHQSFKKRTRLRKVPGVAGLFSLCMPSAFSYCRRSDFIAHDFHEFLKVIPYLVILGRHLCLWSSWRRLR
ncbi:hypothetical protein ACOSP7_014354 [Xanthoceras sorbifolium]